MDIVSPQIEHYLSELLPNRHEVFHRLEQEAAISGFPIIGPNVGILLEMLARLLNAEHVIELGSGYGYSAMWFLQGISPGGRIILTDFKSENLERAKENLAQMGFEDRAEYLSGDALEHFNRLEGPFDIVFSDIDKEEYPKVVDLAAARLRPGGLLITDNALWHGNVVNGDTDKPTTAVRSFNKLMADHPGFRSTIIPLRDGVSIAIKR